MYDWMAEQYLRFGANLRILLLNPSECSAVEILQLLSLMLFLLLGCRLLLSSVTTFLLTTRFPRFSADEVPGLLELFESAVEGAGLERAPSLHRFYNVRPSVFSTGVWKPRIFLAPDLARRLPRQELAAVLVHELVHVKRRDSLRKWLWEFFLAGIPSFVVVFFALNFILNGVHSALAVWGSLVMLVAVRILLGRPFRALRELTCDDLTVEITKDPLTLASSLIKVWNLTAAMPRFRWILSLANAQPFLPERTQLEARIERLLHYRPPRFRALLRRLTRPVLVSFLLACTAFLIAFHSGSYPHSRPMGWDCLTTETIFE